MSVVPKVLSHYYEKANGPFRSLSDLPREQAEQMMAAIRKAGNSFASKRSSNYLAVRAELEARVRQLFIEKGGQPQRLHPHSMILGKSAWLKSWYQNGQEICIPLAQFDPNSVSFTYGDLFPAMRYQDGKSYRGRVYVLSELEALIGQFGLPQDWNDDGLLGPDRYIEAQVWDDQPLQSFIGIHHDQPPPLT
ncbi:MAG: hypothetical protein GC179_28910 [Anaerolineaceae bacterium]|nr:hypothetical protein [Anaerolineaceae bacterium]